MNPKLHLVKYGLALGLCWAQGQASAQQTAISEPDTLLPDVYSLSLDELRRVKIISASKQEEAAYQAPVASTVLTAEEIIRSGATSLPEAL
ncbi:MAG: hypothetical protein HC842_08970, partial [Cytophagales bacterium]|nr:hypothetical protein [Cytophagales bacterium]